MGLKNAGKKLFPFLHIYSGGQAVEIQAMEKAQNFMIVKLKAKHRCEVIFCYLFLERRKVQLLLLLDIINLCSQCSDSYFMICGLEVLFDVNPFQTTCHLFLMILMK